VLLKQNALICFMAHIGSFVPAESALVGITDRIFSRVNSQETVSQAESTCCHTGHELGQQQLSFFFSWAV